MYTCVHHASRPKEGDRCSREDLITIVLKVMAVHFVHKCLFGALPQNLQLNHDLFPIARDGLKVRFSLFGD